MKLIYLMCNHNSGSTIMALLANAHNKIVSPGEVVGPDGKYSTERGPVCSCGVHVDECSFWQDVAEEYKKKGHPWKPDDWGLDHEIKGNRLFSKLAFSRPDAKGSRFAFLSALPIIGSPLKRIQQRNLDFLKAVSSVSKREFVFDASKHPERLVYLSKIPELDITVIHLTRDPRGWCNSRRKNHDEDVRVVAKQWVARNNFMEKIANTFDESKRMFMRYEDFCADPQSAVDRITNLVGIDSFEVPNTLEGIEHHVLGNRMRTNKNIVIKMDTSWQSELSQEQRVAIEDITRSSAERFGYKFS